MTLLKMVTGQPSSQKRVSLCTTNALFVLIEVAPEQQIEAYETEIQFEKFESVSLRVSRCWGCCRPFVLTCHALFFFVIVDASNTCASRSSVATHCC